MKVVCNLEKYKDFINAIPTIFDTDGIVIHKARNEIKVFEYAGKKFNVKKYCIPPVINRIFYSIGIRTPKAKNAYQNAKKIIAKGFSTPEPFGYIIERKFGLINYSYLVTEQIDYTPIRSQFKNHRLIRAVAKYIAELHKNGLFPRDCTAGNILYKENAGKYAFSLVDINRFFFRKREIPFLEATLNVAHVFEQKNSLIYFLVCYSKHRKNFNAKKAINIIKDTRKSGKVYENVKHNLKKIPGASLLINKPIEHDLYKK